MGEHHRGRLSAWRADMERTACGQGERREGGPTGEAVRVPGTQTGNRGGHSPRRVKPQDADTAG